MKKQLGWAIAQKIMGKYRYPNVKIYATEAVALRYSRGLTVVPVYAEVNESV